MQPLTAAPRDGLTVEAVSALLKADNITVTSGCELLNASLVVQSDISDDLVGGSVERNLYAVIHGTCSLSLSRSLTWGVDLVRPYMTLSDGTTSARFNLGVYALTTPERQVGETPTTYDVEGFDRIMLLNREVGAEYSVASGTTYRAALVQAFADAGLTGVQIEGAAADNTLPATKTWPLVATSTDPDQTTTPVTYLRVVNDLLAPINFRSVWADENGYYRCSAYVAPTARAAEWTFDADDALTQVGEPRSIVEDVWATPNRWVFRQSNRASGAPTPTEGDGIYTVVNQSDGATSIDERGLTWTAVIDYEAASQAKLVELGDRRVANDRRATQRLSYQTSPFPAAGHADVYSVVDAAAGLSTKVQAIRWRYDLTGSDVEWTWEVVT